MYRLISSLTITAVVITSAPAATIRIDHTSSQLYIVGKIVYPAILIYFRKP